ncbi:SWIM zinc finger domain-containing protein [Streptomyces sp. NPDC048172]|uniref:SWIM zinc finger family protein n=1 Tax=Streptomyces sp. NPDC048172 TaxID=3365505 RepID=UPI003713BAE2
MGGHAVRWTAEQVMALAPDDASRRAGSKLSAPGPWSEAGTGIGAVWGLCKGSGKKPYQTIVDLDGGQGPGYKCSCPSRKFPCKHAVGLLLLWAGGDATVAEEEKAPEWADGWLSGRRERTTRRASRAGEGTDGGEADGGGGAPSEQQRAAARQRAERRHARIAAGAEELEQRLADLLRGGLAGAGQAGYASWDEMAARMVDAQAPGLASRTRELGAIPASGDGWPGRLLAECALLHLLDQGFLRLDELPEPLAATVRGRVGLTVDAADLLADESARTRDEWLVLAQRDSEEGRLTARRIWLYGRGTGQHALLLSFGAAGRAPELALPVGASVDADVAYYPGARPLRAALGERHGPPVPGFVPEGGAVPDALAAYASALAADPWLDSWPYVLRDVVPVPPAEDRGGWTLAAADEDLALPLAPGTTDTALWKLAAISGGAPLTVFGTCGHQGFAPRTAWSEDRAVPL